MCHLKTICVHSKNTSLQVLLFYYTDQSLPTFFCADRTDKRWPSWLFPFLTEEAALNIWWFLTCNTQKYKKNKALKTMRLATSTQKPEGRTPHSRSTDTIQDAVIAGFPSVHGAQTDQDLVWFLSWIFRNLCRACGFQESQMTQWTCLIAEANFLPGITI